MSSGAATCRNCGTPTSAEVVLSVRGITLGTAAICARCLAEAHVTLPELFGPRKVKHLAKIVEETSTAEKAP